MSAPEAWATVARFASPHEAELAVTALEARGIEAQVLDAETVGVASMLSAALGGVRVQVRAGDAASAAEVLAATVGGAVIDDDALAEEALAAEDAPHPEAAQDRAGGPGAAAAAAAGPAEIELADGPWRAPRAPDADAALDSGVARRALGAALLGLMLPVLPNLYSLVLAVPALRHWATLTGRSRGWLLMALALDAAALSVVVALLLA